MSKIDKHSLTWKAVVAFAERSREEAVSNLIKDNKPERQRGRIALADQLLALSEPDEIINITSDNYHT